MSHITCFTGSTQESILLLQNQQWDILFTHFGFQQFKILTNVAVYVGKTKISNFVRNFFFVLRGVEKR